MGIITRNFANNLTTSGVLRPGAFNNDSFDSVTSAPEGSVPSGSMVFLSSQTASSSSSVSFTSGIDSTYKEYVFYFTDIHMSTLATTLDFQASTDGGSNYNTTMTANSWRSYHREDGASGSIAYTENDRASNDTAFFKFGSPADGFGIGNDENGGGFLHLYDPANTTNVKHFITRFNSFTNDNATLTCFTAGYFNTTSAINAIQFKPGSGTIDDGKFTLLGVS